MIARANWSTERALLLAVPAFTISLIVLWLPTSNHAAPPVAHLMAQHPDVIEYLPAGMIETYAAYSHRALTLAVQTPPSRTIGGWTTVRLHYFPIWQARCGTSLVTTNSEPGTGLLRYHGAGCTIERHRLPVENIGLTLCILAIAALAGGKIFATQRFRLRTLGATTLR